MKELINKLARGVIEYDLPVLETSVSGIDEKVHSEKAFKSSFTVFSSNESSLKGFVYSTNENIVIEDRTFIGNRQEINFSVATEYINDGDEVIGDIYVVSNGGEVVIPVKIKVESVSYTTSIGELKNLFHFANLVQMNYDEALNIFKSDNFAHIFLQDDFYLFRLHADTVELKRRNSYVRIRKRKFLTYVFFHPVLERFRGAF